MQRFLCEGWQPLATRGYMKHHCIHCMQYHKLHDGHMNLALQAACLAPGVPANCSGPFLGKQPTAPCPVPCSRKKGMEFVHEFHGVLPTAFKQLLRNSDERMKKAVTRLVDIWEERKVKRWVN